MGFDVEFPPTRSVAVLQTEIVQSGGRFSDFGSFHAQIPVSKTEIGVGQSAEVALKDNAGDSNLGSAFATELFPSPTWNDDTETRFNYLVRRRALGEIAPEEIDELNALQALRRRTNHARPIGEVIREREMREALEDLLNSFERYVAVVRTQD